MERASTNEQVWDSMGLQRLDILPGYVGVEGAQTAKQQTNMARLHWNAHGRMLAFSYGPATYINQPIDKSGHIFGKRSVDLPIDGLAIVSIRLRYRQRYNCGLRIDIFSSRSQWHISSLGRGLNRHDRSKSGVNCFLNLGNGAKAHI